MRKPANGFSATVSPFRRPTLEMMTLDAKACGLYPNNARALFEAQRRGFDNAVVLDMLCSVAELTTSNGRQYVLDWRSDCDDLVPLTEKLQGDVRRSERRDCR